MFLGTAGASLQRFYNQVTDFVQSMWESAVKSGYKARVLADYGILENETAFDAYVDGFTEQEYNDSIALYNANAGWRNRHFYDVRDSATNTNIFQYSESFTEYSDNTNGTVTANAIADENGYLRGFKLECDTAVYPYANIGERNVTVPDTYNWFAIVKKGNVDVVKLASTHLSDGGGEANFNIATGTVISTSGTAINATISDLGNGWYKVSADFSAGTSDNIGHFNVYFSPTTTLTDTQNGDFGYISKFQLTEGSGVKPYSVNPKRDLKTYGGGGTRFLEDGTIEQISDINLITESVALNGNEWNINQTDNLASGTNKLDQKYYELEHNGTSGYLYAQKDFPTGSVHNWSVHLAKSSSRYMYINMGNISGTKYRTRIWIDFDTKTILRTETPSGEQPLPLSNLKLETDHSEWLRLSFSCSQDTTNANAMVIVGTNSSTDSTDKIGANFKVAGVQITEGTELKRYEEKGTGASGNYAKISHSGGEPGISVEPSRINDILYSYDLRNNDSWSVNGNCTVTLDQIGLKGEANTASLLTDNTASGYGQVGIPSPFTKTLTSGRWKYSIWIKKDNDESRFPEIYLEFQKASDSTYLKQDVQINTKTGATAFRSVNEIGSTVLDRTDWWEIVIAPSVDVIQVKYSYIRPAMGNTLGSYDNSATGSIIVGHVGVYNSTAIDETPIITNGSAVTTTKNKLLLGSPFFNSLPIKLRFRAKKLSTGQCVFMGNNDGNVYKTFAVYFTADDGEILIRLGDDGGGSSNRKDFKTTGAGLNDLNWHDIEIDILSVNTVDIRVDGNDKSASHTTGTATGITFGDAMYIGHQQYGNPTSDAFLFSNLKVL